MNGLPRDMTDREILVEVYIDIKHIKSALECHSKRIRDIEDDVEDLQSFRDRILGVLTGVGVAGGVVGSTISWIAGWLG